MHAQGFEDKWFPHYYNRSGQPHSAALVRDAAGRPWLTTPKVAELARRHFGCPQLLGAPLEDEGGEGERLTHWDHVMLQVRE